MLAHDGSYIRTWKRLSEDGGFSKVDEETFLTGALNVLNYTSTPTNTGNFTAETVEGCGDYGRWALVCVTATYNLWLCLVQQIQDTHCLWRPSSDLIECNSST